MKKVSKASLRVKPGKYQHFKGMLYEVVGEAYHSETLEEMVVYKALYDNDLGYGTLFVRPKKMFLEKVTRDGKTMPRFKKIKD